METDDRIRTAKSILDRVFRAIPVSFAARLWDGSVVALGSGSQRLFTIVFHDPATFRSLALRPDTFRFARAYLDGRVDVEGDLFAAVALADQLEGVKLRLRERVAILLRLLRL
jgi:cyclopropane-fatty-acyl-phospholipid synthase